MMALLPTSPAMVRLLLIFSLSFTLFFLYARSHFYRDPNSFFFDPNRAYERRYTTTRLQDVEQSRHALNVHSSVGSRLAFTGQTETTSPELCVSMTTMKRGNLQRQYIEDAVLSLLTGLTVQERASIHLSLLFTDLNAANHPSWHQSWLHSVVDDVWSYTTNNTTVTAEQHSWLRNITGSTSLTTLMPTKAIMDYSLALERCLTQTDSPYIGVFEGDILIAPGWVATSLRALRSASGLMHRISQPLFRNPFEAPGPHLQHDWLDMRLFNQERSTGWASKRIGGNHEFLITFAVDTLLISLTLLFRRRSTVLQRHLDNSTLLLVTLLIVPISIITFFQSGKASLLPPTPGLVVENFGCCSQALIFNRAYVPDLIEYLREAAYQEAEATTAHVNYDMRTRDFANEQGLDRLALYPVMVQHLGVKSALGTAEDEAMSVWSMAYEDLKESELKARHDVAMREVFGAGWDTDGGG